MKADEATTHALDRGRELAALAREHAPDSFKRVGYTGARILGQTTVTLRMLPAFMLAGTQRGGTTSLYRDLSLHPAVLRPLFVKGVNYFDVNYTRGPRWYRSHFPLRSSARLRAWRTGSEPQTFDASGYYMHHPMAPGRLAQDLPDTKVLVMLRNPVERAHSAWRHEVSRGFETESFERAIELEPERLEGEVERMVADPTYESFHHRHHSYVGRGLYVEQLQRLFDTCGRDRVHVIFSDDYRENAERELGRTLHFLDLPAWRPSSFARVNAAPEEAMDTRVRARLTRYFEPYDEELAQLLGEKPSWTR